MELLRLEELKGFFVFSIRFIVLMDLISTVLSPAGRFNFLLIILGFVYFVYLFVILFTQENNGIPLLSIILLVAIYGLQVILFLLKRQWQHLGNPNINPRLDAYLSFGHASLLICASAL